MCSKYAQIIILIFIMILTVHSFEFNSPAEFSWDNIDNRTYLGTVHNQNFPYACNSGWAFSTISMLQARIKKARKAVSPDISLSTQVLLSCDNLDYGCLGGQPINALRYIHRNNITDQTCHAYLARGYTEGQKCTSQAKCQQCSVKGDCKSQANSKIYGVLDYGLVGNQIQMMNEIEKYGPITCGIAVTSQFKNYTQGILADKTGSKGPNHYVLIYGWGENNGTKYWLGRNSWGSIWGENGNFKIIKGFNNLGLENLCYWGSPIDTWTTDMRNETVPQVSQIESSKSAQVINSKITYKLPDYLTHSRSTLTPHFCESSWAISLVQMLRDRVYRNSKGRTNVDLSVQTLLNCGLGSCQTQVDPFEALTYINKYGIPEQSCQNYKGERPAKENCTSLYNCASCSGTAFSSSCSAVNSFKRWKIVDFGTLSGQQNMISQINSYGPILCGMDKNSTVFRDYEGGIMKEVTIVAKINHYVEIVGYGQESGTGYWIGRNTWGTSWGEQGFFRIRRGGNNLGIEKRCLRGNISV